MKSTMPIKIVTTALLTGLLLGGYILLAQTQETNAPHQPGRAANMRPVGEVAEGVIGSIPGVSSPDPDAYKNIQGFYGPYYNSARLDDAVRVIPQSVYIWPGDTWKASGVLRNQTHSAVSVAAVTVRLLGINNVLLKVAKAAVPVKELRSGEPGPFVIEALVPTEEVKAVEWLVDYRLIDEEERQFDLEVIQRGRASGHSLYSLFGRVVNSREDSSRDVRVVAAWLDNNRRVIYVDTLEMRSIQFPSQVIKSVDLDGRESAFFVYSTDNPSLASVLESAGIAIWGFSSESF